MNSTLSKNDIRFNSGRNYGLEAKNLNDLLSKINQALRKKNNYDFCKKFPYYNEGLAINTAIKEINNYIDNSSSKSSSKLSF